MAGDSPSSRPRRETLLRRLKRAYYHRFDSVAVGAVGFIVMIGATFGLMHFTFFYGGVLDEALNYNIDAAYVTAGVNPSRNSKEADGLNSKFEQLANAKEILRSKEAQEAISKYGEENLKQAYREHKSSPKE